MPGSVASGDIVLGCPPSQARARKRSLPCALRLALARICSIFPRTSKLTSTWVWLRRTPVTWREPGRPISKSSIGGGAPARDRRLPMRREPDWRGCRAEALPLHRQRCRSIGNIAVPSATLPFHRQHCRSIGNIAVPSATLPCRSLEGPLTRAHHNWSQGHPPS